MEWDDDFNEVSAEKPDLSVDERFGKYKGEFVDRTLPPEHAADDPYGRILFFGNLGIAHRYGGKRAKGLANGCAWTIKGFLWIVVLIAVFVAVIHLLS